LYRSGITEDDMKNTHIHALRAVLLAAVIAAAFLLVSCGGESATGKNNTGENTEKNAVVTGVSQPGADQKVSVVFYDHNGVRVGSYEDIDAGAALEEPAYNVDDDPVNTYEFIGWDSNGDGAPEEFPYTVNENTEFRALVRITPVTYHYDIYVRGKLEKSADCHYGDSIDYPAVESYIENEEAFIFLGWKYDGVYNGEQYNVITANVTIEAYFAETQILKLYYGGSLFVKYIMAGEQIPDLSEWQVAPDEGYEVVWYTDEALTNRYDGHVMISGNLTLYGRAEKAGDSGYRANDRNSLIDIFNSAILARTASLDVLVTYDYGTLSSITKYISDNCIKIYGYSLSVSTKDGDNLSFTLKYDPIATVKTSKVIYQQIASANSTLAVSDRAADYEGFAVNKLSKTCTVNNSEALLYVLEQGMRPVIAPGASELSMLYETMKSVLRTYVSDSMTDDEKAFAIYQYIILSTIYDGDLLQKAESGANTDGNRSFCLEGVFIDRLAVCDGISKAFSALCRMEGIECVRVSGTKVGGGVSHAWNKVKIGGGWYVVDATAGGTIVGSEEVMSLRYFLITDAENEKYNKPDNGSYTDLKCTAKYDIYGKLGFSAGSAGQAAAILESLVGAVTSGKAALEIKLDYAITSDESAVKDIMQAIGAGIAFSYLGSDGIFCFIYSE